MIQERAMGLDVSALSCTSGAPGYRSADYAASFAHLGAPLRLAASGGYVLERVIPGMELKDAIGMVPLFDCDDWDALEGDLQALAAAYVSLVLIPTPFCGLDAARMSALFPALVREYKRHYVVDLDDVWESGVSRHHRYYARRGLKTVTVTRCTGDPSRWTDRWVALYGELARRHGITGIYDLPPSALAAQLTVPGMQLYIAQRHDTVLGMQLWLRDATRAYHHLSAYSDDGYRGRVSYAMVYAALSELAAQGVRKADLGAGAGQGGNGSQGLDTFKAGWTPHVLPVYLCGRVFHEQHYRDLCAGGRGNGPYFPAYRGWKTP